MYGPLVNTIYNRLDSSLSVTRLLLFLSPHVQPDESFFSDDFLFPMTANSGSGSTSRLSYTSGIESDGEFIDSTPTPRASRNTLTGPPTMIPTPQSTANLPRCSSDPNLADDDVTDGNGGCQLPQTNGELPLSQPLCPSFTSCPLIWEFLHFSGNGGGRIPDYNAPPPYAVSPAAAPVGGKEEKRYNSDYGFTNGHRYICIYVEGLYASPGPRTFLL